MRSNARLDGLAGHMKATNAFGRDVRRVGLDRSDLGWPSPSACCGVIKVHQDAFALDGSGNFKLQAMLPQLSF